MPGWAQTRVIFAFSSETVAELLIQIAFFVEDSSATIVPPVTPSLPPAST